MPEPFGEMGYMDIWDTLYEKAKEQYHPKEVSPFVYAHHVVCALEAENGEIYTGFCIECCSGVLNLCAERVAAMRSLFMLRFDCEAELEFHGEVVGKDGDLLDEFVYQ